jgi:hypothetical protein
MGKVSENKFVGQPILRQIVNILPREKFDELVIRLGSDKYYKAFFSWDQLIVMLFGIFPVATRWVKSVTACVPWVAS